KEVAWLRSIRSGSHFLWSRESKRKLTALSRFALDGKLPVIFRKKFPAKHEPQAGTLFLSSTIAGEKLLVSNLFKFFGSNALPMILNVDFRNHILFAGAD